jgi:DNA repair exonuclease SbcCD nuclease subunit
MLEYTVRLEKDLFADGVIWAGDVFHHKQPNRNSHSLVQRTIEIVQQYKNLWIVPGNHDLSSDRFDSVFETQPLGVLFKAGAKLLKGWAKDESPIYGVPWLQRFGEQEVFQALEGWRAASTYECANSLVVAHAPLYPLGHELEFEYYPTKDEEYREGWSSAMGRQGFCYYGHVHEAHGVFEVDGVTYCNQGALSRGSLHESELSRKVAVTLWQQGKGFYLIDVPHKPANKVFRLIEKTDAKSKAIELDDFLASIGETQLEITSIEAVTAHIREMGLAAEVSQMAIQLLEEASA